MVSTSTDIFITGVGCLLPGCNSPADLWQRLLEKNCATVPYISEDAITTLVPYFGHISQEQTQAALAAVPFKLRRYATPASQWGVKATVDAIANAQLDLAQINTQRIGLFTAQGDYSYPSLPSYTSGITKALEQDDLNLPRLTNEFLNHRGMDPFLSIKGLSNNSLAIASLTFGTRGDCGAYVQNKSATVAALRSAMMSLRYGYSDVALVICTGTYNEMLTLTELYQQNLLSPTKQGTASLRPFDQYADGSILGEGAIAFVLETRAHAQKRNAVMLAKIDGIENKTVFSSPDQLDIYSRCAQKLLRNLGLDLDAIDAIIATGAGGKKADQQEIALLENLLSGKNIPITCASPITGNLPACPVDLLVALQMLKHQQVPAIANLTKPQSDQLLLVKNESLIQPVHRVLTLNRCYTGFHSAMVLSSTAYSYS
jgi:3-oxoacyl-[acyl-carrier-protein] synthase II